MNNNDRKELWYDIRLTPKEVSYLWGLLRQTNKEVPAATLAGNIYKSEEIIDKDNWFYEHTLKKLTERMFYREWDNYYKYIIDLEKEEPSLKFEMNKFWVNYQKQHEFNPLHDHSSLFSFVIFMKIPTHWRDQHSLPIFANSNFPCASDFQFVVSEKGEDLCMTQNFTLSPEDEGRMLFFPSTLLHQVYPFYECEELRITISGNIVKMTTKEEGDAIPEFDLGQKFNQGEVTLKEYKQKENMLKILEGSISTIRKEMEQMKKSE